MEGWGADCELHPLIHTSLKFTLAQDIESIKSGAAAPQCSLKSEYVYIESC
jgi:hypothetical protein